MKYFIGVLPIVLIILLFIFFDREKSNKKKILYFLLFIFGMIGSYITYRVENKVGSYFPEMVDMNYLMVFIYAIFGVAIYEEGVKLFFLFLLTLKEKYKKDFSWIVLSVICSMGYACFENIVFYIMNGSIGVAFIRMFTSIPSHMCFAIVMGELFSKYKNTGKFKYLILSLIVPSLIHAFYNTFLYKGWEFGRVISFSYLILLFCFSIFRCYKLIDR